MLPTHLEFRVAQSDIDASHPGGAKCPTARAILRTYPYIQDVCVGDQGVYLLASTNLYHCWVKLAHTSDSTAFWQAFDAVKPVKPISFKLEIVGIK